MLRNSIFLFTLTICFLIVATGRMHAVSPVADPAVEKVYLDKCSVCHGEDGAGKTAKGKKLNVKDVRSPEIQKMTDAAMAEAVLKGKGKDMDGFEKELGADMCRKLVSHMRDLAKK